MKNNIVNISEHISTTKLLEFALDNDSIDLVDIRNEYEKMKREQYLNKHNHNVWKSEDGKWRTYLDDEESPRGYKLKVRTTEKAILDLIVEYYISKEEDPFIDKVFSDWLEERKFYEEISNQTYHRYKNDFKRFFPKDCMLMKIKFRDITESDLKTFIRLTIKEKGLSQKGYANLRILIKGIFIHGKEKGLTNISITSFLGDLQLSKRAFTRKTYDKESEVFTESEIGMVVIRQIN